MSKSKHILALVAAAALVAGCAGSGGSAGGSTQSAAELDALTQQIVKQSFHDKGIVKVADVFRDDETTRLCNAADVAGKPLDGDTAKRIEELNMKAIKWPSDGKFLGDWREGEKIAQSGRGMTWTDTAKTVVMADPNDKSQAGASIPGMVSKVNVKPGDQVKVNDVLAVIEAMKMETSVVARMDGTIDEVFVKGGQTVKAGELLLTIK